uniref:Uncharacterized protein n=1 Tax=Tanacetum cinerariifolium TaxID=118510 RepID=A0A6L2JZC3_TANCI|nr:hypothetical protein [Tanacetum cinerariifolium]
MNPQKKQVAARDDKWVPFFERVKISYTNIKLETTVLQKEETFQVVIDLIKNSTYFKAFTISADVPEIFMQQFWYFIKKLLGIDSYGFLLANKKCTVNAEVFRKILDIFPRVGGVDFMNVLDNDTALTFLIYLGYKESEPEPEPEPEPATKKTSSKRRVKKKVTLSADDNIISDDPDAALELAKSIRKTKAEETEAVRKVHATYARIVTEHVPDSARRKKSGKLTSDPPKKVKSVPSLTQEEQEAADIMKAVTTMI